MLRQIFVKRDIIKILVFAALIALFLAIFLRVDSYEGREETQMVQEAVRRAVLTCYAVEGDYPDTIDYLKENYRLSFDEDRFFVTYNPYGENMSPDIYVTERGAQASE